MMRTERATSVLRLAGEPVSPIALPAGQKAMAALLTLALWSRADGLVRVMSASPVE
jgi:hypothetical protein